MFSDGRLPTRVLCFSLSIRINLRKLFRLSSASLFCSAKAVVSGISPKIKKKVRERKLEARRGGNFILFCLTWQMFCAILKE